MFSTLASTEQVNLSGAKLPKTVFNGVNLAGAVFDQADLVKAELRGVDLRGASLVNVPDSLSTEQFETLVQSDLLQRVPIQDQAAAAWSLLSRPSTEYRSEAVIGSAPMVPTRLAR